MTQRDHTVVATILVIIGLYIIGLSALEIQPWDEGLYAVRGEGIVLFGNAWDQTPHALGGLYSSTPPPVASWGVAGGVALLGRTPLGVRLFSLLCSGLALYFLFQIVKRFTTYQAAIVSVVILGMSLHWLVYSRQAMTEVPLMMFTLLALWSSLKNPRDGWVLFAVGLGGALMTKMTVGLVPILFLLPWFYSSKDKSRQWAITGLVGGLLIAFPWYAHMLSTYGNDFFLSMSIPHVTKAIEGNTASLGPLYYVNQIIVAHPTLIVAFLFVVAAIWKRVQVLGNRNELLNSGMISVLLWWSLGMLVFSFAATKNPHYVVMLLPPAVIVSVVGFQRMIEKLPHRSVAVMYAVLFASSMWSAFPALRDTAKEPTANLALTATLIVVFGLQFVVVLLPTRLTENLVIKGYKPIIVLCLLVGGVQAVSVTLNGRQEDVQGGREIASRLLENTTFNKHFTYLYHQHNAGDAMNPQLAWYTAGWMQGWNPEFTYEPMHMPEGTADITVAATAGLSNSPWIVYYHPGVTDEVVTTVMASLAVSYVVDTQAGDYVLFSRR